jgi:hypothetical protein
VKLEETVNKKEELFQLEEQGWQALSSDRDNAVKFYDTVLTNDAIMVFPGGLWIRGKEAILDSIREAEPWLAYELDDLQILDLSADTRGVVYRASAKRIGGAEYKALMSSLYIRQDGKWKMAFHQQSPV